MSTLIGTFENTSTVILNQWHLTHQQTFGNVCRYFWLSQLGERSVVEGSEFFFLSGHTCFLLEFKAFLTIIPFYLLTNKITSYGDWYTALVYPPNPTNL